MEFYCKFIDKVIKDFKREGKDPCKEVIEINDLSLQEIKYLNTYANGKVNLKLRTIYY